MTTPNAYPSVEFCVNRPGLRALEATAVYVHNKHLVNIQKTEAVKLLAGVLDVFASEASEPKPPDPHAAEEHHASLGVYIGPEEFARIKDMDGQDCAAWILARELKLKSEAPKFAKRWPRPFDLPYALAVSATAVGGHKIRIFRASEHHGPIIITGNMDGVKIDSTKTDGPDQACQFVREFGQYMVDCAQLNEPLEIKNLQRRSPEPLSNVMDIIPLARNHALSASMRPYHIYTDE